MRKPNAQQSLLEGAAIARRAERRRRAGLSQQGGESDGDDATGLSNPSVEWVGCQWLMDGYCGRAEGDGGGGPGTSNPSSQRQQGDGMGDDGQCGDGGRTGDNDPPQRPNRAA